MINKLLARIVIFITLSFASIANAQGNDGIGQTIQIYTHFKSFVNNPTWLLIIRDIDHNQNIPYLFEINKGDNFWVALTYGRNYVIQASRLKFQSYNPRTNRYRNEEIKNFCQLESNGRIIKGESMYITINGRLTRNSGTYSCYTSQYPDSNFSVSNPNTN